MAQTMSNTQPTSSDVGSSSGTAGYLTDNLELAAYLLSRGHRLIGAAPRGNRIVTFTFDGAAAVAEDVSRFFAGDAVPATRLFEHYRTLRAMIVSVRNAAGTRGGVR